MGTKKATDKIFFEKINKIDETLARFTKKKKKDDTNVETKET